jgi:hypothetical protein
VTSSLATSLPHSGRRGRVAARPALVILGICLAMFASGCVAPFPPPARSAASADEDENAQALFERSLAAHGGDLRESVEDINLSLDGTWGTLIQRIQPLVADADYRTTAEERYRPGEQIYSALWRGPAGTKKVVRTPTTVEVFYNGIRETDRLKLEAAAMTADAFQFFHLGPSFLQLRQARFSRVADGRENGVTYHRLRTTLRPGFGFSPEDEVVVWIDPSTHRFFRVHFSLNGFARTRGAHVDTTIHEYRQSGPMLVPIRLTERVRGPIRLKVHEWWITGADFNRGWNAETVQGPEHQGTATAPAQPW